MTAESDALACVHVNVTTRWLNTGETHENATSDPELRTGVQTVYRPHLPGGRGGGLGCAAHRTDVHQVAIAPGLVDVVNRQVVRHAAALVF